MAEGKKRTRWCLSVDAENLEKLRHLTKITGLKQADLADMAIADLLKKFEDKGFKIQL